MRRKRIKRGRRRRGMVVVMVAMGIGDGYGDGYGDGGVVAIVAVVVSDSE